MFDLIPYGRRNRNLNLFDEMARFLDRPFFGTVSGARSFNVDVIDKDDHFLLKADLPGVKKEDIKIELDGKFMMISAEQNVEKSEETENYVYKERSYGSCSRSFDLTGINTDDITGKFRNGVLELTLPKKGEEKKAKQTIEIDFGDDDE
ncbi:MAG: Hsp20/alpha crystallin family protein [Clostridiaceae bacterium]|nr:Hsp20/alpha crystallin family protein [Clostridiaceae bacterium]